MSSFATSPVDPSQGGPSVPTPPTMAPPSTKAASDLSEHAATIRQLVEGDTAWDRRLMKLSQWVNPILVKETRQALKSKQFSFTLILLTIVVLAWSILAIVSMIPSIYYASNGAPLLIGYAMILLVPALIIIPQASFRSMASELEDGTFETLSLSMLSPRHIMLGKLSVAALQLVVYVSVIAPCIALTYLLRGVTLEVIAMTLMILICSSLALSTLAISVASFSRSRVQQVFFSIILLGAQVVAAFAVGGAVLGTVSQGSIPWEGWIVFGVFLLGAILYCWLFLRCGGCAIGVVSENRSTPIRIPLLAIGLVVAMVGGLLAIRNGDRNSMSAMIGAVLNALFLHWGVAGSIMMGEQGIIPARARRSLPSSLFARLFLTWLNPGAGPGYLFVLLSFAGPALTLVLACQLLIPLTNTDVGFQTLAYAIALVCFLALYLGVVRLICLASLRRLQAGRLVTALTICIVLLILAVVVTCSVNLAINNYQRLTYDWYCFPNLFWTLSEIFPGYSRQTWNSPEILAALFALLFSSIVVGSINIVLTAKDVVILRIETPKRVELERQRIRTNKNRGLEEPDDEELDEKKQSGQIGLE